MEPILNLDWTNSPAFSAPTTWDYDSPASYYFWGGFVIAFVGGLVSLALRWVRQIIGGGVE